MATKREIDFGGKGRTGKARASAAEAKAWACERDGMLTAATNLRMPADAGPAVAESSAES